MMAARPQVMYRTGLHLQPSVDRRRRAVVRAAAAQEPVRVDRRERLPHRWRQQSPAVDPKLRPLRRDHRQRRRRPARRPAARRSIPAAARRGSRRQPGRTPRRRSLVVPASGTARPRPSGAACPCPACRSAPAPRRLPSSVARAGLALTVSCGPSRLCASLLASTPPNSGVSTSVLRPKLDEETHVARQRAAGEGAARREVRLAGRSAASLFSPRSTSLASAPTCSQSRAISLMNVTDVARKALSACLVISADSTRHPLDRAPRTGAKQLATARPVRVVADADDDALGRCGTPRSPCPGAGSRASRRSVHAARSQARCSSWRVKPTGTCDEMRTSALGRDDASETIPAARGRSRRRLRLVVDRRVKRDPEHVGVAQRLRRDRS